MSASGSAQGLPRLAMERPADLAIRGDQVLDLVRRRWVRLTPEEWVRQHVLGWLRDRLGVPLSLVSVEREVVVGGLKRRADILVRDRKGAAWMVVEVKAAGVTVGQPVAEQVGWYNTVLGARYVVVTDGLAVRGWQADENGLFRIMRELPNFTAADTENDRV